jgi:transposase
LARRSATEDRWRNPFSDDLRCRILQGYERKEGSQRELAQRFGVGFEYVRKIRRQWRQNGQMERAPQSRHGRLSRVTEAVKERLRGWLRQQPDRNLAELGEHLQASGVEVGRSRISQVLQQMGLPRKKNLSMRRSATRKPTASGAKSSWRPSPRSRRKS